ncbi:hypothetical protein [Natronomonas sp. EA1]|uniref:hypothetical protein n=1 Tax=Natronomonas sp. EA1 TaxID=3421655 RepID=UPI003EBCE006
MRRMASMVLAALLVLSVVGMPTAAALGSASTATTVQEGNQTNNTSVSPGERLSGIIGVQEAEIEGEVEERAFGIAIARAATDGQRADAVLTQINESRERLAELREQRSELEQARENGSISEGTYRAKAAALAERVEMVKRLTNRSASVSEGLPEDLLREKGINVTAIKSLATEAETLTGPEVAAIARSIAGGADGTPEAYQPPNASAAIDHAEMSVQTAREQLNRTRQLVNDTNASENATEALAEAAAQLERAEAALERARNASAAGDENRARMLAEQAADAAQESLGAANDAGESARDRAGAADRRGGDRNDGDTSTDTPEEGDNDRQTDGDSDSGNQTDGGSGNQTDGGSGNQTDGGSGNQTDGGSGNQTDGGSGNQTDGGSGNQTDGGSGSQTGDDGRNSGGSP